MYKVSCSVPADPAGRTAAQWAWGHCAHWNPSGVCQREQLQLRQVSPDGRVALSVAVAVADNVAANVTVTAVVTAVVVVAVVFCSK